MNSGCGSGAGSVCNSGTDSTTTSSDTDSSGWLLSETPCSLPSKDTTVSVDPTCAQVLSLRQFFDAQWSLLSHSLHSPPTQCGFCGSAHLFSELQGLLSGAQRTRLSQHRMVQQQKNHRCIGENDWFMEDLLVRFLFVK